MRYLDLLETTVRGKPSFREMLREWLVPPKKLSNRCSRTGAVERVLSNACSRTRAYRGDSFDVSRVRFSRRGEIFQRRIMVTTRTNSGAFEGRSASYQKRCEVHEQAHAKLNLRLEIVGRRKDDYHLLSMLCVSLSLHDSLVVRITEGQELALTVIGEMDEKLRSVLANPESNLVGKAVREFTHRFACELPGLSVSLTKRIPCGGGLGGGSADAAAMLRALGRLFGERIMRQQQRDASWLARELVALAPAIGSDVPFAVEGGCAVVQGIGEDIWPVEERCLDNREVALIVPPFSLSTPEVYGEFRRRYPQLPESPPTAPDEKVWKGLCHGLGAEGILHNDLLQSACALEPRLAALVNDLTSAFPHCAGMTGSGSVTFVLPAMAEAFSLHARETLEEIADRHAGNLLITRFRTRARPIARQLLDV